MLHRKFLQSPFLYGSMTSVEKRLEFKKSKSDDRLHGIHELNPRFGVQIMMKGFFFFFFFYERMNGVDQG